MSQQRRWKSLDLLAQLRIGPKLLLAPGLVLLILLASSGGAYWALWRQNQSLESIVQVRSARIRDATELVAEAQSAHARAYQLLTWISGSFSLARIDALAADIERRHGAIEQRFSGLRGHTLPGSAERRLLEQSQGAHADYLRELGEAIELARADQTIGASAMQKPQRAFETVAQRLQELAQLERELSEAASLQAARDFRAISTLMPLLAALSVVLSLAITLAVRRSLLRQVRGIDATALDLASGNLTVPQREYGVDEIADTSRTLDASIRNLSGTLRGILDSARSIDDASRAITAGNADLTHRSGEQANSIEQTAASILALSATVSSTADTAQQANRLAASASTIAQKGGGVAEHLTRTLAGIGVSSARVMLLLEQAEGMAARGGTLTLNAAVEAARLGEQGGAFAALTGELRALAQQSAGMLAEMRALVAQSMVQIEAGRTAAEEAGFNLADIASSVREVGDMIDRISHASVAQASGISHVNTAIVQMDQVSQKNAALVAQAATAAQSLQSQAVALSRAVAGFRLDDTVAPVVAGGRPRLRLASKR
ncbi:methyl-accepting chemotaxis protein [Massilia sp. CF038]|uniref:methyl-accepting chemotaxis protein n=1 Tax=Massilia sp. CF038 TaxID=1881045 RepID=UPI000914E20B|nr:methyl-accepting chemotaxis protein [Massilia sp. CF038]SHG69476.1 methyl-accepting chemotaxis protein [Massilia sp. CF038]